MSENSCSAFPNVDFSVVADAIRTFTNLAEAIEAQSSPEMVTPAQEARLREFHWRDAVSNVRSLLTKLETTHEQCHERLEASTRAGALQTQLTESLERQSSDLWQAAALQTRLTEALERQSRQPVAVPNDVRKELQAAFDVAQEHLVRSYEATLTSKREALERQHHAREVSLVATEADLVRRERETKLELVALKEKHLALERTHQAEVSELESKLEARIVEAREHERTYQAKVSELQRALDTDHKRTGAVQAVLQREYERQQGQARALQNKEVALDDKVKSIDEKEVRLGRMIANLRDALQQLEQPPSKAVVDRFVRATEDVQKLEQTLAAPIEAVVARLVNAIEKWRQSKQTLSSERRAPSPRDPSVDRESGSPPRSRRLTPMPLDRGRFVEASPHLKRLAEASPELSGDRASPKKARLASRVPLRSRPDLGDEFDRSTRLPSYELGSPRGGLWGRRDFVRDSVELDTPANLRVERERLNQGDEELGGPSVESLGRAARLAYDQIEFPTDGSWTEDLDACLVDLLRRDGFREKYMDAAMPTPAKPAMACFRMAFVSKKPPRWQQSTTTQPQSSRCDTCRNLDRPACIHFSLCEGVSAVTRTNAEGKRWKLSFRT